MVEKSLIKMARQLKTLDEASLVGLWEKYEQEVNRFEPTGRWEEAVLVFGLIQALRWKNQLFNYNFKRLQEPSGVEEPGSGKSGSESDPDGGEGGDKRGKLLSFRPRKPD